MSFPHFAVFISLWRMAEPKLGVSCCFLSFWSFMTKSILSLDIEKQYLHKVSFKKNDCDMKLPNFTRPLYGERAWAHQKNGLFLFLLLNLNTVLSDSTPENSANIRQIKWNRIRSIKFETMSKLCEPRRPTQTVWPLWCLDLEEIRGTERDYSSKPLKYSIVERILVFKR